MATVEAKVFSHHLKKDGTYNVKIHIFHNQQVKFLDTEHFVSQKKLKPDPASKSWMIIKDAFVQRLVYRAIDDYREKISALGNRLHLFSCEELRDYLERANKDIHFIEFCTEYIELQKTLKKDKTAANFNTVKNSLIDFFRRPQVAISDIDVEMLGDWETFLRTERTMVRITREDMAIAVHLDLQLVIRWQCDLNISAF